VKRTLYAALHRFRDPTLPLYFWIDAARFNQDDIPERSSQACGMKRIYSRTGKVVVWLGEEEDIDREAFKLINDFECTYAGSDQLKSILENS